MKIVDPLSITDEIKLELLIKVNKENYWNKKDNNVSRILIRMTKTNFFN